ncbi:MAG: carboxypeptidase-like regulatory domain-containing protein [Rubripirellula sp.]
MSALELAMLDLDYGLCMSGEVPLAEIRGTLPVSTVEGNAAEDHLAYDHVHEMMMDADLAGDHMHDEISRGHLADDEMMHDQSLSLDGSTSDMSFSSDAYVLLYGFDHADVEVAILREADQYGRYSFDGLHTGDYFLRRVFPNDEGKWQAFAETENIFVMPGEVAEVVSFQQLDGPTAAPIVYPALVDFADSERNAISGSLADVASNASVLVVKRGEATADDAEPSRSVEADANLALPEISDNESASSEGAVSGSVSLGLDRNGRIDDRPAIIGSVRVVLEGVDGEGVGVRREAFVDSSGRFRFEGVPAGYYELSVRSALIAIENGKREIIVNAGEELEVDLAIELKPLDLPVQAEVQLAPWGWSENSLYLTSFVLTGFATTLLMDGYADRARRGIQRTIDARRQRWLRTSSGESG